VIAYFDTSAIVPLLIDEPATERCREFWLAAHRLVTTRLARVEARAALAQAERSGRISRAHLRSSSRDLDLLLNQLEFVEVDDALTRSAGDLAETHALRAYDAVHLAAASEARDPDFVVVAGDQALLAAARSIGLTVTDTS
jgi:predicted nucleic acid-binding protein